MIFMQIQMEQHTVREVFNGYSDNAEDGVYAFGGKLSVRPPFQREFCYNGAKQAAVIETVMQGFPLNVMYWCHDGNGNYELLDGQQRTLCLCKYVNGEFAVKNRYFHNLTQTEKDQILDYPLMIYVCEGTDKEKLDWFKIVNIAGEKLFDQELRNAVYAGSWLADAKRYFSKNGCAAYQLGSKYLNGSAIRQDYLQTVIEWIASIDGNSIEGYMAIHQHDTNAAALWIYFQSVINWVRTVFPNYRREMKGIQWGLLYNRFKDSAVDPAAFEERIKALMMDDEVQKRSGIYEYLLSGDESKLGIRTFTDNQKRIAYEQQDGICVHCGQHFEIDQMDGDHITPWRDGGKTVQENCQMLCRHCNRSHR